MSSGVRISDAKSWSESSSRSRQALIKAGKWINDQGWCPATGGNFSARLYDGYRHSAMPVHSADSDVDLMNSNYETPRCVVTASGFHKGHLREEHFLEVDLMGQPIRSDLNVRPSAETLVHVALYRLDPDIGAVLHAHSVPNTVLSLIHDSEQLMIQGFEMQKALSGQLTHETSIALEIVNNTQDMPELARWVEERWHERGGLKWGLLVRGHGVYVWGRDVTEARRHLEGVEFLLSCLLELKKLKIASQ
jgi:methylthioribulose-1-phosphate dehydratase